MLTGALAARATGIRPSIRSRCDGLRGVVRTLRMHQDTREENAHETQQSPDVRRCAAGDRLTLRSRAAIAQDAAKPNILVIFGDDIGWFNASAYNSGLMGYQTPNIDSIGQEGAMFTDWYAQQSCTAGRAAFITGQSPIRTGLTKVGLPGADVGLQAGDPTIAAVAEAAWLRNRTVRQEPSRRPRQIPADGPWLRRVLRQPLPSQCRRGAGERRLPERPRIPGEVRPARRVACLGHRHRRHDGRPAVGRGRQAADRKHRPAHDQAHGDGRRGIPRRGGQFHGNRAQRRQALLCLVQRDADAHLDPSERGVAGKDRARHLPGRHGRV